jgi:hypothetical protein
LEKARTDRSCAGLGWPVAAHGVQCPQPVGADINPKTADSSFWSTWAAQGFRSAKALFVFRLKRDIVPSVAWA